MAKKINTSETKRIKTPHAAAAQAIRQDLKKAWPGVEFAVTSQGYSMGNSVSVRWTDGPTAAEVGAITGRYKAGHFDGMQDLYEYTNLRADIPQVKFVSCSREMSDDVRAEILSSVASRFFDPDDREGITENSIIEMSGEYVSTYDEHTPPIRRITVSKLPHSGGKVIVKTPHTEIVLTRDDAMTLCHDLFVATDETEPAA